MILKSQNGGMVMSLISTLHQRHTCGEPWCLSLLPSEIWRGGGRSLLSFFFGGRPLLELADLSFLDRFHSGLPVLAAGCDPPRGVRGRSDFGVSIILPRGIGSLVSMLLVASVDDGS